MRRAGNSGVGVSLPMNRIPRWGACRVTPTGSPAACGGRCRCSAAAADRTAAADRRQGETRVFLEPTLGRRVRGVGIVDEGQAGDVPQAFADHVQPRSRLHVRPMSGRLSSPLRRRSGGRSESTTADRAVDPGRRTEVGSPRGACPRVRDRPPRTISGRCRGRERDEVAVGSDAEDPNSRMSLILRRDCIASSSAAAVLGESLCSRFNSFAMSAAPIVIRRIAGFLGRRVGIARGRLQRRIAVARPPRARQAAAPPMASHVQFHSSWSPQSVPGATSPPPGATGDSSSASRLRRRPSSWRQGGQRGSQIVQFAGQTVSARLRCAQFVLQTRDAGIQFGLQRDAPAVTRPQLLDFARLLRQRGRQALRAPRHAPHDLVEDCEPGRDFRLPLAHLGLACPLPLETRQLLRDVRRRGRRRRSQYPPGDQSQHAELDGQGTQDGDQQAGARSLAKMDHGNGGRRRGRQACRRGFPDIRRLLSKWAA